MIIIMIVMLGMCFTCDRGYTCHVCPAHFIFVKSVQRCFCHEARMSLAWLKDTVLDYLWNIKLSRRGKVGLAVLTGISLSILAGYLLRQQRRRYRPVAPKASNLHRASTFREPTPQQMSPAEPSTPPSETTPIYEETDYETGSVSSDDSFHSTVDILPDPPISPHALYLNGLSAVSTGSVCVRTMRTDLLHCSSKDDFLAKVYCVRLAFDHLVKSPDHCTYFEGITRSIMCDFLASAGENPAAFCEQFDGLLQFLRRENAWTTAVKELTVRRVGAMNVYDIAVDFILLDAFDDLESPPSAFVSVLQNRWITSGMKRSALSAALWSILRAKRGLLKHKNGFMSRFYGLSETISPALAWGFLGTDESLKATCTHFKAVVLKFIRSLFSLDKVRYTTVTELAEDMLRAAQDAADTMKTSTVHT